MGQKSACFFLSRLVKSGIPHFPSYNPGPRRATPRPPASCPCSSLRIPGVGLPLSQWSDSSISRCPSYTRLYPVLLKEIYPALHRLPTPSLTGEWEVNPKAPHFPTLQILTPAVWTSPPSYTRALTLRRPRAPAQRRAGLYPVAATFFGLEVSPTRGRDLDGSPRASLGSG